MSRNFMLSFFYTLNVLIELLVNQFTMKNTRVMQNYVKYLEFLKLFNTKRIIRIIIVASLNVRSTAYSN